MTRLVLAHCSSGLANRIKGLVTSLRVADELGVGLRVYWEVNPAVPSPLEELFVNRFECVDRDEATALAAEPGVVTVRTWRLWPSVQDPLPPGYRPPYPSPHRHGIDFGYHQIPQEVRAAFRPWFSAFQPHPAVRAAVDTIFAGQAGPFTGMAVRTWVDAPERRKLFNVREVEAAIEAAQGQVYLTSDARQLVVELARRWPGSVLTSNQYTAELTGAQPALCDLLAVARCPRMWVSLGSTFSEVAWWMGGAQVVVMVIPPRNYLFNVLDLGEVAAYALGGRWRFKMKSVFDMRLASLWRRLHA